jgi:hypothetical protein
MTEDGDDSDSSLPELVASSSSEDDSEDDEPASPFWFSHKQPERFLHMNLSSAFFAACAGKATSSLCAGSKASSTSISLCAGSKDISTSSSFCYNSQARISSKTRYGSCTGRREYWDSGSEWEWTGHVETE